MIRGRICPAQNVKDNDIENHVCAIDLDEGVKLNLPLSQVRVLPPEMKSLPCQAVRVDIGLDCIEQFEWPEQINTMLMRAIGNALIFVTIKSKRPGSVPTIDADVTIVNPSSGQSISIQKWLIEVFSQHLDLCCFDRFKPFPVGMPPAFMVNNVPGFQQPGFGFGMPGAPRPLNVPSILPGPSPAFQVAHATGMPFVMQPRGQLPPPGNQMPHYMTPGFPVPMPPSHSPMSGMTSHYTTPNSSVSYPLQAPPGSTVHATVMSLSVTQPMRPAPPPPPTVSVKNDVSRKKSSNGSSTGPSATSSVIFESDSSQAGDSDSTAYSESTAAIDVNSSFQTCSSSGSNPNALPFYPREYNPPPRVPQNVKIVEIEECPTNPTPSSKGAGGALEDKKRIVQEDSNSSTSLSVEAKPFIPKSATIVPTTKHSQSPNRECESLPTPLGQHGRAELNQQFDSSTHQFPQGKEVQLKQILRDWKIGQVVPAFMARVWNPSCFEVNVIDKFSGLLSKLQAEMNDYYKSHKINMSSKHQAKEACGDFCACYDADEDLWLRVQVYDWFLDDSVTPIKVWAVDYGGYSHVDLSSVQPLATKLACTTPVLITLCSMINIIPRHHYDIWPEAHLNKIKEIMPEDKQLYLRIDGAKTEDDIWPVSVFTDPGCSLESINETLVAAGYAYYVGTRKENSDVSVTSIYEDAEDPMAEAYERGGNNYDLDDEDACVAVSGRKFTEEVGICWFYQRNGYCYKKFCELRHERLDPDGHTTAKEPVHHDSFETLHENVLQPGSQIKITVTRIMTVHHFIATISTKGTKIQSRETLKSMLNNLNTTQMKRQLKTFTEFPADGEIVLYKDHTGTFYRGRVICADIMTDDHYKILNVDTGYKSKVPLKDLRRVDPAFLHHPFQAIECWLADVAPTQTDKEWTKTCNSLFADLVKDQRLKATVVRSAPWGIEVNLVNKNGEDIAVVLKEMGVVKSCPRRHLPLDASRHLPG